jgi:hypothetical protein
MPLAGPLNMSREETRTRFFKRQKLWVNRDNFLEDAQVRMETDQEYADRVNPLLDIIEAKQISRNSNWKKGDLYVLYWKDIEETTGAIAYVGDF